MNIYLFNTASAALTKARLLPAEYTDMRSVTDGWMFSWRKHYRAPGAKAFKIVTDDDDVQGLMIFQMIEQEPIMAYLESAPHNRGADKLLDYVAGCLIAYACQLSLIHGEDHHQGFLSFQCMDEEVIKVYHYKYGAQRVDDTWMFIDPETGGKLIDEYLERNAELTGEEEQKVYELKQKQRNETEDEKQGDE